MKTATPQQVLDCPMGPNDAEAATVREYLGKLLLGVWVESARALRSDPGWCRGFSLHGYRTPATLVY